MSLPGLIGSADLTAGNWVQLGSALAEPGIVNITVCNRNTTAVKISIAIGYDAPTDPGVKDHIQTDMPLAGNMPMERNGRSCSTGAKIWVRSDTANVSACAEGVPST